MKTSNKNIPKNINEYIAGIPEPARSTLIKLRQTIKSTVPDSEEIISYRMPAFRRGGILVYYAAFRDHCSLFPGASVIEKLKDELKAYKTSKGTIQFTIEKPLPASLVKKIIKTKIREIEERKLTKKK